MLELLKNLAFQKLQEKMQSNSLGAAETTAAAEEGSSQLVNSLMGAIGGGNLSAVTSLFSNDGNATEDNGIFQSLTGTLGEVLQSKGMSAQEAQAEASNIAPGLVDGLKEKFLSNAAADSGFDLSQLASLAGGDSGSLLDKAKGLF